MFQQKNTSWSTKLAWSKDMQLTLSFESASLEFLCKYHMKTKEHKLRHSELQIIDLGNPSLNSKSLRKN